MGHNNFFFSFHLKNKGNTYNIIYIGVCVHLGHMIYNIYRCREREVRFKGIYSRFFDIQYIQVYAYTWDI